MNRTQRRIVGVFLFVALILAAIYYFDVKSYFSLLALQDRMQQLYYFVQLRYVESVVAYIVAFAAIMACAVPAMPVLTVTGGYLFGAGFGLLYAMIGCLVGATISFLAVRYIIRGTVHQRYGLQLERFKEKLHEQGVCSYLLMLQFITVVPFFVINTLAALADVSFFTFFWTTAVGSLPMVFVYALAGKQLGTLNSINDLFSPSVVLMIALLVCLSLMPILVKRLRGNREHR